MKNLLLPTAYFLTSVRSKRLTLINTFVLTASPQVGLKFVVYAKRNETRLS